MASQNIARLGVVLGLDSGELVREMEDAQKKFKKFTNEIKRDTNDAAKATVQLEEATKAYGRTLTKVEEIQIQIETGKFKHATDTAKKALLEKAAAYDKVAASAKKANEMAAGSTLPKGGMTAQQQAALGYQTTDIITSLAGGQNPLMVMLQQGGQLRDQFGGFKPLFAGIAASITPIGVAVTAVAAGVGALSYAMVKGAQDVHDFNNAMTMTGKFAGITYSQFEMLSRSLQSDFGGSIGSTKEILQTLVASGQFTAASLESVAAAVKKVSSLSGEDAQEVAKNLISSLDGTASSAARLNKQYHFLTFEQYRQIAVLQEQGKTQEAIILTSDLLTKSLSKQEVQLGWLEKAWKGLKEGASEAWEWMKSIGREETPVERMVKAAKKYSDLMASPRWANTEVAKKALAEYEQIASKYSSDAQKIEDEAIAKAKEAEKIKLDERIGGLQKFRDIQKQIDETSSEAAYQRRAYGLQKIKQLEEQAEHEIAKARLEQERLAADEGGATRVKRLELATAKEKAIREKLARDIEDINKESRKFFEDKAKTEQDSINNERERMNVYKNNILTSQQDLDIALSRLKTEQDLVELSKRENMKDVDREVAVARIKNLGDQREALIMQREELKRLQDMNQSVFNNMGSAIDNFVRTGKFAFKDFARSVIQDLIAIAMKAQMMQMFRGFSFFGSGSQYIPGSDSFVGPMPAPVPQANGGPVDAGMPYYVGEQGPELFVPQGAGTIMPNKVLGAMSNNQPQVVYNGPFIQNMSAIDTQSATQFLLKNKNTVWAANQSASRSVPASR